MTEHAHEHADVESALDRLAEADGAGAPGLEERVFAATRATLRADEPPAVVARIGWSRARAAAAIVIVGATALTAALLTRRPAAAPTSVDAAAVLALDAVDAWLEGSPLGEQETTLDELSFAIVEFDPRSAGDWLDENLLNSEGDSL